MTSTSVPCLILLKRKVLFCSCLNNRIILKTLCIYFFLLQPLVQIQNFQKAEKQRVMKLAEIIYIKCSQIRCIITEVNFTHWIIVIMRKYIIIMRSRSDNQLAYSHSVNILILMLSSVFRSTKYFPVSQTVKVGAADEVKRLHHCPQILYIF